MGKEIVPVNSNDQQGKASARKEVVSDVVFTPKSTGVGSTSRSIKEGNVNDKEKAAVEGAQKESTATWVSRTFNENLVATNQSCQDIPSQATEIDAALKLTNVNGNLQLDGRKIWSQQVEEDPEEGELPEGAIGEEESSDEENDQEEQSVNNKGQGQQSIEQSKGIEENCDQGDRSQKGANREDVQKCVGPNPSKDIPPDKPNIPVEKQAGGTDLVVEHAEGQIALVQTEIGIEKANLGVSDSIQSCENTDAASASKQIVTATNKSQYKFSAAFVSTDAVGKIQLDSAGILLGTKQFQSAAAGNQDAAIREAQGQGNNQATAQGQAGKEIVPVNASNVLQTQDNGATGKEIVPVNNNEQKRNGVLRSEVVSDGVTNQKFQTSNMFAILEGQDSDDAGKNQIVVVEDNNIASPVPNTNTSRRLNPTAATFTPKSTGVGSTSRKENNENPNGKKNAVVEDAQKESTAAWVIRAFTNNIVATNQSCQEVPSQAIEIDAALKITNVEKSRTNQDNMDQGDRNQSSMDRDGVQIGISTEPTKDVPPDKHNMVVEAEGTTVITQPTDGQIPVVQ
ncbi:hypothetical protein A4A49_22501 [Nicotiana attenuata]|uniref:Uncharacterized protein n=1 Tax=Nicotiana attenuata TaxID=49451 RepID=A0A1J6L1Q4_NICAT|nr:hypothetical protein A4A49_22501 [Nicotiana attenuata]